MADNNKKKEDVDTLNQVFIQDKEEDDDDAAGTPFILGDVWKEKPANNGYAPPTIQISSEKTLLLSPSHKQQDQNMQYQSTEPKQKPAIPKKGAMSDKSSKKTGTTVHFGAFDAKDVIREESQEVLNDSPKNNSQKNQYVVPQFSDNNNNQIPTQDHEEEEEEQEEEDINPDYGKGETPLDLFLESSYEEGRKTVMDPITVFKPKVEPLLSQLKDGDQTYIHFNEKSYYFPNVLRKLDSNDGFLGYYSLPQTKKNQALKMLVCVTMYSEERVFLEQTLYHIFRNQQGFLHIGLKDFQIVVVVIQDGITKMKEEVVDFYCDLEGENRNDFRNLKLRRYEIQRQTEFLEYKNQKKTLDANEGLPYTIPKRIALVYQNRLQFIKEHEGNKQERPKVYSSNHFHYNYNEPGLTVLSVFKHKNAKKLSSHMWFFEGFCRQFRPKYCALVDVGTLPAPDGLLKFYISMEGDPRIGGVCGFLGLEDPPEYDEQEDQKTPHMMELEETLKQKKANLFEWQKRWKAKQNEAKQKQEEKAAKLQEEHENLELEQVKQIHFYKSMRNTMIFQYTILLPFMLVKFALELLFKSIFRFFGIIFRGLSYFGIHYLDMFGSLKKAQLYEYTMAHMVDKNFESLLGFLHVLPGAWSAYRYQALEVKFTNRQNLLQKKYFKQLINPDKLEGNIKEANMFLAEDRILCLGIYCQPDSDFILKFIPDAQAFTDPVGTLEEFMNQRRRWINSTLFALDYVLKHYKYHVYESNHSPFHKKFLLPFNMLFARIGDLNTYFIPAFYFFVAIMSSFQLMSPAIKKGYQYIPAQDSTKLYTCIFDKDLNPLELECNNSLDLSYECWIQCQQSHYPKVFYVLLNLIPAIYIICFVFIVFASLNFKIKLVGSKEYEKLRRSILTDSQAADIQFMEHEVSQQEKEMSSITEAKEIKKVKKQIQKDKKEITDKVFSLSQHLYSQLVGKISEHHVKLNAREKKFKIEYDRITSQEYANNMFKILATIMSLISMVIAIVVSLAIAMNVFNSSFGLVEGFTKLGGWMRVYIIVMVILNLGSFFIILFVHLLQPKLVWYIVSSFWSYIVFQPVYNFILIIFSFCNIDDVTWGTKGLSDSKDANSYYLEKVKFLVRWFSSNIVLLLLLIGGNTFTGQTPYIILGIGMYGTGYLSIKTILAVVNYIKYFLVNKLYYKYQVGQTKKKNLSSQELLMKEYNKFITMQNERNRSASKNYFNIYQQNQSISGAAFNDSFGGLNKNLLASSGLPHDKPIGNILSPQ